MRIQTFKALVENQFSLTIKAFQTDGGGEFTTTQFESYLCHQGTHHHIFYAHTQGQNDIVERKHRHIIETWLALMAQAYVSKVLWVESFLTAVFLINQVPSIISSSKTSYEVLYHKRSNYSLFRVFVCLCFPFLRPYHQYKLD